MCTLKCGVRFTIQINHVYSKRLGMVQSSYILCTLYLWYGDSVVPAEDTLPDLLLNLA